MCYRFKSLLARRAAVRSLGPRSARNVQERLTAAWGAGIVVVVLLFPAAWMLESVGLSDALVGDLTLAVTGATTALLLAATWIGRRQAHRSRERFRLPTI